MSGFGGREERKRVRERGGINMGERKS